MSRKREPLNTLLVILAPAMALCMLVLGLAAALAAMCLDLLGVPCESWADIFGDIE